MRDRVDQLLKIGCFALGALVLFQVGRAVMRNNPLERVSIPAVPTLDAGTNAVAAATNAAPVKVAAGVSATNAASGTNAPVTATNAVAVSPTGQTGPTSLTSLTSPTNALPATNFTASAAPTNFPKPATNLAAAVTNAPHSNRPPVPPAMAMMGMPGAPMKPSELPATTKARVDRITDSEILGQVIRPMPMALLGIAGSSAFLRTASGQTGLVKEGDSLGDLKLLRIGINRVLVEQDGQKKELTIFSGYGSESLLTKQKETPDETTSK